MKFKILTTCKISEKYQKNAIAEYQKRLSRYCDIKIVTINEKDNLSRYINEKDYVISIDEKSDLLSSTDFASRISDIGLMGNSSIVIILCSGIEDKLCDITNLWLSISKMKFDNGLLITMIYEQIYRAYRILRNEPYHK